MFFVGRQCLVILLTAPLKYLVKGILWGKSNGIILPFTSACNRILHKTLQEFEFLSLVHVPLCLNMENVGGRIVIYLNI